MITGNTYYSKCSNLTTLMEFYIVRSPNFCICGTATVNTYYILIKISLYCINAHIIICIQYRDNRVEFYTIIVREKINTAQH